jgi:hypothetical protein
VANDTEVILIDLFSKELRRKSHLVSEIELELTENRAGKNDGVGGDGELR